MDCKIKLFWDSEAAVWMATSDDLPALALEAGSVDALIERVKYIIPELLEIEDVKVDYCDLDFVTERRDRVRIIG
ncbi:MAG: DUF1902 domain-containing protein [Synergistaceae bacterium]|nr:DUF1902 domain-containing protein [Synergistaceae bacterium]